MSVWLKDDTLFLRSPEPEDLELLYKMENDTALWEVGSTLLPYSRHTLREYLKNSTQDLFTERQARFVIELNSGECVGMIDLAEFDPINGRAEVCIGLLGAYCGKGIASRALNLLCDYALCRLHLHQLYAYIPEKNMPSRKLFSAAGFEEGVLLKEWKRSETGYENVLLVQKMAKNSQF